MNKNMNPLDQLLVTTTIFLNQIIDPTPPEKHPSVLDGALMLESVFCLSDTLMFFKDLTPLRDNVRSSCCHACGLLESDNLVIRYMAEFIYEIANLIDSGQFPKQIDADTNALLKQLLITLSTKVDESEWELIGFEKCWFEQ